jgi:hypothetical protein
MYLVHYVFVIWLQYLLLGAALFAIAGFDRVRSDPALELGRDCDHVSDSAGARLVGTERLGPERRVLVKAP